MVLVAAPAGFGKTSVLTEWLASQDDGAHVAWLSLDERDNDAALFWTYLFTALNRAEPGIAGPALDLLTATQPLEAVLATLINDLEASATEIVLVLDDFHVIDNTAVQEGMAFLVDNLPINLRLVIASRADPAMPLARLRARGELVELRAADLRFSTAEVASYLTGVMGLTVHDEEVVALGDRTEGWIAAIQLAALSMQGRDDAGAFIAGFAGDDRFVVDYLVEEVLLRQPEAMRTFLLETSILSRLTGDLCDALTDAPGGASTLDALDRANIFLVPLDDYRQWYRYHHLFAEMLRARLFHERPGRVAELHSRASEWFERHGQTADAIEHAIHAGAFARAGDLISAVMPVMQQQRQELTLVRWFEMLPPEAVRAHPSLSIGFAGTLLSAGRTDGVDALLRDAEAASGGTSEATRAVRSGIALYRAAEALTRGDFDTAFIHASHAVELSRVGAHIDRGSSTGLLGLVLWARGDLAAAHSSWTESLDHLYHAGHLSDMMGGSIALADIQLAQGRLTDAQRTYRRGIEVAGEPPLRGAADMHVGMSGVLRELNDLDGAVHQLDEAESLGEHAGLPQNRHRRRIAAARIKLSVGDVDAAIALLDEAESLYTPDFFPDVRPIPALRARAQLADGRTLEALDWARQARVSADDELTYIREFDHITLARVLLGDPADAARLADAAHLLERLLTAAERGGRGGIVIEILILQSLAFDLTRRMDDALDTLQRAVRAAEPEGYVRVFADEGEPMARLLGALAKRDGDSQYLRHLRTAATASGRHATGNQELIEPLSEREIDVIRLLMSELAGPEIAQYLFISLNTLRTHTKNIYAKLGVTSRREAVRRAAQLGIVRAP
jgi:LuxR family maltose regulon positive regulatory protein